MENMALNVRNHKIYMCLHYTYFIIIKRYNFAMHFYICFVMCLVWWIVIKNKCISGAFLYIGAFYQGGFYLGANSKGRLLPWRKFYRAAFTSMTITPRKLSNLKNFFSLGMKGLNFRSGTFYNKVYEMKYLQNTNMYFFHFNILLFWCM